MNTYTYIVLYYMNRMQLFTSYIYKGLMILGLLEYKRLLSNNECDQEISQSQNAD